MGGGHAGGQQGGECFVMKNLQRPAPLPTPPPQAGVRSLAKNLQRPAPPQTEPAELPLAEPKFPPLLDFVKCA
jgi:hypothetical protein